MDQTLFWLILACRCTPSLPSITEEDDPKVFQTPPAIVLSQLNSTAELRCSTTSTKPIGLYLKQRYPKERELFYLYIPKNTTTINQNFKHRLSVKGQCCDFTLQLSELQIRDTDGYYCEWLFTEPQLNFKQASETVIVVRDGDPEEECNKRRMVHHMLLMISVAITATMFIICVCLLIWRVQNSHQRHESYKVRHRHHQPQCPSSRR
ncbi:uncharacterized protein [Salminus brasiliensis]|uniref:uncharacterized protein n=1 Tax=Salminus brasiliensis TaxID=930266 RepID=UPI003B839EF7